MNGVDELDMGGGQDALEELCAPTQREEPVGTECTSIESEPCSGQSHGAEHRSPEQDKPNELNDQAFLRALQCCRFAAEEFRHRDHIRLAWILLRELPLGEVLVRLGTDLRRFAAHHGVPHIYNETLTWVYVMVINQRMLGLPGGDGETGSDPPENNFAMFCACNLDLFQPVDQFMAGFYEAATWRSEMAKSTFLLPDCPGLEMANMPSRTAIG